MTAARILSVAAVAATAALALMFRHQLPPIMVVHWGADNVPNGYASRDVAISIIPGIAALCGALLSLLSRSRGTRTLTDPHSSFERIGAAILLSLFAAQALIILRNLGTPVNVARCSLAGVGALIAVIGNYLGKIPPNSGFGVRNRWTLSSEMIWRKVHRRTGFIMFAGGAIVTITTLLAPAGTEVTLALTLCLIIVAVVPPLAALGLSMLEASRAR